VDCAFGGGVAALSLSRRNYSAPHAALASCRCSWRRHATVVNVPLVRAFGSRLFFPLAYTAG
ncbi:MAG: hypothetical protein KDI64_21280, partial [Candidatus Accumulibacter sp.]|nr:hypothetical protein [Accumulibacter sp.]